MKDVRGRRDFSNQCAAQSSIGGSMMIDLTYCEKWRLRDKSGYERLHIASRDDLATLSPSRDEVIVSGLNQEYFEQFCASFANRYRIVQFLHCNLLRDFTPLAALDKTEFITIDWVQKATKLWDMSGNSSLLGLGLRDINKLSALDGLETAPKLREFAISQNVDAKLFLATLEPLAECPALESIEIRIEGIRDGSAEPVTRIKNLKKAGFSMMLFETEQFAMLAARLSDVDLQYREPYIVFQNDDKRNVLPVGKGKRWLSPGSPKLRQCEAEWAAYIEKYRG
jgi:hypothetical protein